jgi:Na+/H+-dicarboxylate symporter
LTDPDREIVAPIKKGLSLSTMIFMGLGLGVLAGLFFGEMVAFLEVIGEIWIKLLQMTVLPYVMLSLVTGLGRLDYADARLLASKVGLIMLLLWAVCLAIIFVFPFTFPHWESASFFSNALADPRPPVDFLGLYIPSNPFHALANNLVPAVVVFSVAVGIALIGIKDKDSLLDGMETMMEALMRVAHFIVKLTPIGVFAITAAAAGTMQLAEIQRLGIFIWAYVGISLLTSLWILPGLVMALTPLSYRQVVGTTRDALLTAFATGSLFVVLPMLVERSKRLITQYAREKDRAEAAVEVIVPVSFSFPHAGKLFTLTFVLFAGWYSGYPVEIEDFPAMAAAGLASLFASASIAVPFIMETARVPSDLFQLFLATGVINSRFATLLAAMFVLTLTLLGAFSMNGLVRIKPGRVLRYVLISVGSLAITIVALRTLFTLTMDNDYNKDQIIAGMQLMDRSVPDKVYRIMPVDIPAVPDDMSRLQLIRSRELLRVCYDPNRLPFSYFNGNDELVGFDIALIHKLASSLGVHIEFLPADYRPAVAVHLNLGDCDLGTGMLVSPYLAVEVTYSESYLDLVPAFLVPDHRRNRFYDLEAVAKMRGLSVAFEESAYFRERGKDAMPHAEIRKVLSPLHFIKDQGETFDIMAMPAQEAAAWSLLYPEYSVVVPTGSNRRLPLAFPLPYGEEAWADYLKLWIDLNKKNGTIDALYDRWILGKQQTAEAFRWSIIRDVLHWVD